MRGRPFTVPVEGGEIGSWVNGSGLPVLLLHAGPAVSFLPDTGHFPWMDQPGCVRAALGRLVTA
jgi:hypothetical protein